MTHRVVVTGMAGLCPLGTSWGEVKEKVLSKTSGVVAMPQWTAMRGLQTRLGARVPDSDDFSDYPRKKRRTMGRVALLAAKATHLALQAAGLSEDPIIRDGRMGIAYGSTSGSPPALEQFIQKACAEHTLSGVTSANFIQGMSHTCAANLAQFFEVKGRVIPTCSACASGSQGIGCAYEAIKYGLQEMMIAGGAEELDILGAAVFDILYATSTRNDHPHTTPRPYDVDRDGLVVGEGAGTLILESLESARARKASLLAEIVGFATNCDGRHVVNPSPEGMRKVMELALQDARLSPDQIDYVNAHATATDVGDIAESKATRACFRRSIPISSLKGYMGHTLGACGAIEAWLCIHMMNEGWLPPTMNLHKVDPACAPLDYITSVRERRIQYVMSNNFAFGGINTSLIFKKL